MRTIAFMNQKGGVGKTTTTVNLGALLAAEHGKRVLLIDLDPQGNLSDHVGFDPNETDVSIYNVLIDGANPAEVMQTAHGMDVLPANLDLSGAEVELAGMMMREGRLKNNLGAFPEQYDYVLIDCPPSLGLLTISALTLAQSVIIPMQAEYLALRGLSQLVQTVGLVKEHLNPELEVVGVVFCMYDGRTNLAQAVRNEVDAYFPGRVYESVIRKNIRLAEAPSHGKPISVYDATCLGTTCYCEVTDEFLRREDGWLPEPKPDADAEDELAAGDAAPIVVVDEHEPAPSVRAPLWKGDEAHEETEADDEAVMPEQHSPSPDPIT